MDAQRRAVSAGGSARSRSPRPRPSRGTALVRDGEAWVALGVVGLGLFFLVGSLNIRVQPSYATIGPRFFPTTVGLGLIGCGLWTLAARVLGVRRHVGNRTDTHAEASSETALQWVPFLMVAGALMAYVVLLPRAGFVLASALLFGVSAYALGSRRVVRNAVVGLAFAAVVYLAFTRGLGLYLPESALEHWLMGRGL